MAAAFRRNLLLPLLALPATGTTRPADLHVAIRYRGNSFWIDGKDASSKRMFLITQILLPLNDTSNNSSAPLVTIPTG